MHMAVVGKGGSGKSLTAGTLARVLARRGARVLTLDSDLVPGLSVSLGLGVRTDAMLMAAAAKNEHDRWDLRKGIGPVRAVQRYSALAPDGVRHLQCGKVDEEGYPAIMPSVNAFYRVVHRIGSAPAFREWTIVGDLPAGPRQIAYDWVPYAKIFVLITEPTWKSGLTARRIAKLVRSRPGSIVLPVATKVRGRGDRKHVEEILGEHVVAAIPADDAVTRSERRGLALIDTAPRSRAARAIEGLADTLQAHQSNGGAGA